MPSKPVFIVSDVHLGAVPPETERAFRRWLVHVKESGERLIINGDLFDFWFEYRHVVLAEHVRVLAQLADLVDAGVPVLLVGGNHDWWGGRFLREEIGVDFRQEPVTMRLHGRTVLLAHGDGLGAGDLGYRCVRLVLRSRLTRWLFRWLHPDLGARLARRVSGTTPSPSGGAGGAGGADGAGAQAAAKGRLAFLTAWARQRLEDDPGLDIVATGHAHSPAIVESPPGRYYVNSGDWLTRRSYVTLGASGVPALHEWEG